VPAVPRTEKNKVAKGRDVMQESADELLMATRASSMGEKIISTYVPLLRGGRACLRCGKTGAGKHPHAEGCDEPGYREIPLLPRPNTLVETGRCSYESGLHGLPRKRRRPRVHRGATRPRVLERGLRGRRARDARAELHLDGRLQQARRGAEPRASTLTSRSPAR
jgi:hypothetical protein